MNRLNVLLISRSTIGLLLASVCGFWAPAAAPRPLRPSGSAVLNRATTHAAWFNWADATAEFQEAQRLLIEEHDQRKALYAKIGVLRATMEAHSLSDVRENLRLIAQTPEVQHDPELLLFASIAK